MSSIIKSCVGVLFIALTMSGCCKDGTENAKMFEIANRQMEFNDFKVLTITGLIDANENKTQKHLDIVKNCNEFHKNILDFQNQIKDKSTDQKALRLEINSYLDRFLQEVNPELSHESYLDGAISRGLLAIELSYIEKSFLDEQEHRANND